MNIGFPVNISIEEYISTRVDDQIEWYDKKSMKAQKLYKRSQFAEIIISALIPVLTSFADLKFFLILIAIFGATISAIESLVRLYNLHEDWIEYRVTSELLKYHKNLYLTRSGLYNETEETIDSMFISNIENIISSENSKWKSIKLNKANRETSQSSQDS